MRDIDVMQRHWETTLWKRLSSWEPCVTGVPFYEVVLDFKENVQEITLSLSTTIENKATNENDKNVWSVRLVT